MPRRGWATALLLAVGLSAPAAGQLPPAAPIAPTPPADLPPAADPGPSRPARISILGDPIPLPDRSAPSVRRDLPPERTEVIPPRDVPRPSTVRPAVAAVPSRLESDPPVVRTAAIGRPIIEGDGEGEAPAPVAASRVEGTIGRTSATAAKPADDPIGEFFSRRSADKDQEKDNSDPLNRPKPRASGKFGDRIKDAADSVMGNQHDWFRSDHAFDCYISPVTNPFLFEDPRSLTEVRPIFLYQHIPSTQADFHGGNIAFFGTQLRLAITERFSMVFNKLGGIAVDPSSSSPYKNETGFSELWFGPKYTFIRDSETAALMAGGLQFQLPVGNASVFQHTGKFSLVPYLSYAHPFFREARVGALNTMFSTGYSFSTDHSRSDYYYLSAHADLNVANWNRIFPLAELNWFMYTTSGRSTPIGSEGRDLINFGGQAKGSGLLTGALGARFKITESAQIGAAYEVPLAGRKDLFSYRFTLDFILRY